jgi:hypothetical protein
LPPTATAGPAVLATLIVQSQQKKAVTLSPLLAQTTAGLTQLVQAITLLLFTISCANNREVFSNTGQSTRKKIVSV